MAEGAYSTAAEEIKSRCNIVDLINPLVPLKRAGSNYKGCCPFHKEKTPSFIVSETRQTYHCFGCGEHGDAIGFVMTYYSKSYTEAVEQLAAQYGVEINLQQDDRQKSAELYYEANRLAARFFFSAIAQNGSKGFEYMTGRGIEPKTLQKFGIGYADESWTSLTDQLTKLGVSKQLMAELGLCSHSQEKDRYYDRFRGRVIFPIINTRGKVVGFGGRIIGDGEPKYLNSPESFVFQKKDNLFGLNLSRTEIQKEGFAIFVEGYMDVVGLYQSGVRNVVASLGTALTPQQAKLISRYTKQVVLCYDADGAGRKAALRGIDVLRAAGMSVRVLHVDDGKDPDEYVKKHGKNDFLELIDKKSLSDIDYKVNVASQNYDLNGTESRISFFKEAAAILAALPPVEKEIYIKKVSRDYGFSEGALKNQVEGTAVVSAAPPVSQREEEQADVPVKEASQAEIEIEKLVIRLIMLNSSYYDEAKVRDDIAVTQSGRHIFSAFEALHTPGAEFDLSALNDALDYDDFSYLEGIIRDKKVGDDRKDFDDCIDRLERNRKMQRILELGDILAMSDNDTDPEYIARLTHELQELSKGLQVVQ